MCSQVVRQKSQDTCLERYGESSYHKTEEGIRNLKESMFETYGNWWIATEEGKQKSKDAQFAKNGTWNCATPEHQDKTHKFKRHKFTFPSGKSIMVLGYEDVMLYLLLQEYAEEDIVVGNVEIYDNVGEIQYIMNGKSHRYFPDIYIRSLHKMIEVKSPYTMKQDVEINQLKKQATLDLGIGHEFVIIPDKDAKQLRRQMKKANT